MPSSNKSLQKNPSRNFEGSLQVFSRVFSEPNQLLEALTQKGFDAKWVQLPQSVQSSGPANAQWSEIRFPAGAFSPPSSDLFCYLSGKHSTQSGWGLVLVESQRLESGNQELLTLAPFVLSVKGADAAMDLVLRKMSLERWAGRSASPTEFPDVTIEDHVHIGPDCVIEPGCVIESGVRIGARVRIGASTRIGANSRIGDHVEIGSHCEIMGPSAIGGPGFGLVRYPGATASVVRCHVGRVVVGDRVRMGSFVSIDRGVIEDTMIGSDTVIDDHVHIGHNCEIGERNVFCGFVGFSGSTRTGSDCVFAGLVGTGGHVTIGDGVTVAAQSGINADLAPHQTVKGYPPRPMQEALKLQVLIGKLPELYQWVKELRKS